MTAHDKFRALLRGGIIGLGDDEATLRALDIPPALWPQVRAAAGDVRRVHNAGAHQDSRDLADEWARLLGDNLGDSDGTGGLESALVAKVGAPTQPPPPAAFIDNLRAGLEGRNPNELLYRQ